MPYAGEFTLSGLVGKIAVLGGELERLKRGRAIVVTGVVDRAVALEDVQALGRRVLQPFPVTRRNHDEHGRDNGHVEIEEVRRGYGFFP